ncbi:unnamed protein product [Ixodes hexagonus]
MTLNQGPPSEDFQDPPPPYLLAPGGGYSVRLLPDDSQGDKLKGACVLVDGEVRGEVYSTLDVGPRTGGAYGHHTVIASPGQQQASYVIRDVSYALPQTLQQQPPQLPQQQQAPPRHQHQLQQQPQQHQPQQQQTQLHHQPATHQPRSTRSSGRTRDRSKSSCVVREERKSREVRRRARGKRLGDGRSTREGMKERVVEDDAANGQMSKLKGQRMAIKYIAQLESILSSQASPSTGSSSGQHYDSSFFPSTMWATAPNYYSWIRQEVENGGPSSGQPTGMAIESPNPSAFSPPSPKYFNNNCDKVKEMPAEGYWHHDGAQTGQFVYQ